MTIRELYERALAEGKADMTVVFPNRDYEYAECPYILATGITDDIERHPLNDGFIVITGDKEVGKPTWLDDDYDYIESEE